MTEMIERICRIKAAKHYAKRFGKPETDEHVLANVESNWNIYAADVRDTIEAMREPTQAMVDNGNYRTSVSAAENTRSTWRAMIDAALPPADRQPTENTESSQS